MSVSCSKSREGEREREEKKEIEQLELARERERGSRLEKEEGESPASGARARQSVWRGEGAESTGPPACRTWSSCSTPRASCAFVSKGTSSSSRRAGLRSGFQAVSRRSIAQLEYMSRPRAPRGRGSARRPRKHRWTGHLRQRLSPPPCPRVVGDRQQHFLWRFSRNSSRQNTGNGAEDATRPSRGSLPRPPEAAQCAPFAALRRSPRRLGRHIVLPHSRAVAAAPMLSAGSVSREAYGSRTLRAVGAPRSGRAGESCRISAVGQRLIAR